MAGWAFHVLLNQIIAEAVSRNDWLCLCHSRILAAPVSQKCCLGPSNQPDIGSLSFVDWLAGPMARPEIGCKICVGLIRLGVGKHLFALLGTCHLCQTISGVLILQWLSVSGCQSNSDLVFLILICVRDFLGQLCKIKKMCWFPK